MEYLGTSINDYFKFISISRLIAADENEELQAKRIKHNIFTSIRELIVYRFVVDTCRRPFIVKQHI